jgi:2-polyprenyl-6-methoxyphenol hydroxylase-like FAD-dependent oxidoreductase
VLVDDNSVPVKDYRASTFHPPTLDLLQTYGVADALVAMDLQCSVIQYRDRTLGPVAELDLDVLAGDTKHPYRLQCELFLVAGAQFDFKSRMDAQSVNYTSDPDEWFLLLQMPDMWRIVVPVAEDISRDEAASEQHIQRCLQNICPSEEPYDNLVRAVYRVHQRVAGRYRTGSVFLAGDAAGTPRT